MMSPRSPKPLAEYQWHDYIITGWQTFSFCSAGGNLCQCCHLCSLRLGWRRDGRGRKCNDFSVSEAPGGPGTLLLLTLWFHMKLDQSASPSVLAGWFWFQAVGVGLFSSFTLKQSQSLSSLFNQQLNPTDKNINQVCFWYFFIPLGRKLF